jgi:hypothetical protein
MWDLVLMSIFINHSFCALFISSHKNENGGNVGNPVPNGNPETLTALAAQLVDLLKMGANANR